MQLVCSARQKLLRRLPPCEAIWITDDLLSTSFNRFLASSKHQSARHGSNVPGPLEAQNRLSKRRMNYSARSGNETSPPGLPAFAFPERHLRENWQWEPPSKGPPASDSVDWVPTLDWLIEDSQVSDESAIALSQEGSTITESMQPLDLLNHVNKISEEVDGTERKTIHSMVEILKIYMWKHVTLPEYQNLLRIARISISSKNIDGQSAREVLRNMSQVVTATLDTPTIQRQPRDPPQRTRIEERLAGELLSDLWSSAKSTCTASTNKAFLYHILSLRSERLVVPSEFEIIESLRTKDEIFAVHEYLAADLAVQRISDWAEEGHCDTPVPDLVAFLLSLSNYDQSSFIVSVTAILTYKFITRSRESSRDSIDSRLLTVWLSTIRAGPWAERNIAIAERFVGKYAFRRRDDIIRFKVLLDRQKRDVAAIRYHRTRKIRSSYASTRPNAPISSPSTDPDLILPQNVSSLELVEYFRYSSIKSIYQFILEHWVQNPSSIRLRIPNEQVRCQVMQDLESPASITSLSSSEYFINLFEVFEKANVNLNPIVKFLFPLCRESGHEQLVSGFLIASKDTPWKFPKHFWIDQIHWLNKKDARAAVRLFNENQSLLMLEVGALFATSLIHNPLIAPNEPIRLLEKQSSLFEASTKPTKAHARLVHTMAHAYASAPHLYPLVALRQVRRCIWHLARCDGQIHPDMPRALAKAGILRFLEQNRWVGNIRVQEIISHIRLLQGRKAARKVLIATNIAKKNLHQRQMRGEVPWTDPRVFPRSKAPKGIIGQREDGKGKVARSVR
jgi:hypothetical protein